MMKKIIVAVRFAEAYNSGGFIATKVIGALVLVEFQ